MYTGDLAALKEDHGFWLPNELVDLYLPRIRARGLAAYCCVARSATRWHYPGVVDLACTLRLTERRTEDLLQLLYNERLLNVHDLKAIHGVL